MNENSKAITILCSHIGKSEDIIPLEPKEWSNLAQKMMERNIQPSVLLNYSTQDFIDNLDFNSFESERLMRLIDRSASLTFEIDNYENRGIYIITRADKAYPHKLKKKLGNSCPPLFYYSGNINLLNSESVGYVGSRNINDTDIKFTENTVEKTVSNGYSVVSGGAKGIDTLSTEKAINMGGQAISYLSDSMLKKIKKVETVKAIQNGSLLLLSVSKPDAPFNVGIAMMRNKYIYAQSNGTVVIRSDYNKGGTWTGATENLRNNWSPTLCWNKSSYKGNIELIKKGAFPIDEKWDGKISSEMKPQKEEEYTQISMFDLL